MLSTAASRGSEPALILPAAPLMPAGTNDGEALALSGANSLGQTPAMQYVQLAYAILCVFGAAIVRGYSGFGFSLLAITSLSLVLPPAQFIPSIFMMEIAASLYLLPGVWHEIHWKAILWLAVGCLIGTPFGVYALAHVPARADDPGARRLRDGGGHRPAARLCAQADAGHRRRHSRPGWLPEFATGASGWSGRR